MAEPRAVLDEKDLPDPPRIVARHRDRHLVALPGESTIGVAEQRAAGYLPPPLLEQWAEGRPEVSRRHVVERAVKRCDQIHAFGGGGQAQRREGSGMGWDHDGTYPERLGQLAPEEGSCAAEREQGHPPRIEPAGDTDPLER